MVKRVDTAEVRRLAADGAQLVEVLPAAAYVNEHIPGAQNIPLDEMGPAAVERAGLSHDLPTIVYCYDHECDLSSRGAAQLETLGFSDVYDYVPSKTAWMAEGLAVEGSTPESSRAGSLARDVPLCHLDDEIGEISSRFVDDWTFCVVVNDERVVLGVVRADVRDLPPDTPVREVIQSAPPSVRPSVTASELAQSMEDDARAYVLVTTSHGELMGALHRSDLYGQH